MTVVGTRPEIIRLARVMNALDNSDAIEHVIVHTGQNYDYSLNEVFFKDLVDHCFKTFPLIFVKLIIVFFKLAFIYKL